MAGLPVAYDWVIDDHRVYATLIFGLGAAGAGRIPGLDSPIDELGFIEGNTWPRYLLG